MLIRQLAGGAGSGAGGRPGQGIGSGNGVAEVARKTGACVPVTRQDARSPARSTGRQRKEKEKESMTTATSEGLKLTDRINRIEPSATMAVVAEADKLRAQGIDVVDL